MLGCIKGPFLGDPKEHCRSCMWRCSGSRSLFTDTILQRSARNSWPKSLWYASDVALILPSRIKHISSSQSPRQVCPLPTINIIQGRKKRIPAGNCPDFLALLINTQLSQCAFAARILPVGTAQTVGVLCSCPVCLSCMKVFKFTLLGFPRGCSN